MSLHVERGVSLKPYNSFGIDVLAAQFAEARSDDQVRAAIAYAEVQQLPLMLLGGGSNLLLTADVQALVLRMSGLGIRILSEDDQHVVVEAEAGEPWHPFVQWTLDQGLAGLENLSLIPGTVGAAPMQNIGAYGVEIKDVFVGLTALDRHTGEVSEFSLQDCQFGYRDSLFKRQAGRWIILRVRFALSRAAHLNLAYGPVKQRLSEQGIDKPTAQDVSRAICAIRSEKLPDPAVLGNAGSFFKNPVVSAQQVEHLRQLHADLVAYPQDEGQFKVAAGWLIERAGWKGFRDGDAGVHKLQALVLVNYGHASGEQILDLAKRIQADIKQRFAIELEIEPNVV
ncbi:UDP-N-acetylmuramate dehydrogenase [Pseudomonas sp. RL_15y_Pfl2_60]|uniref:UDP-N-acetylmuramate dehydrogenase n=1 Tax=Pseudomonas sp. RL_15y_Pfl2_60 TaxID=3088709 RepID=UPI0030D70D0E